MSNLIKLIRKAGLMQFLKPIAEGTVGMFGLTLQQTQQVPTVNWLGLCGYPIRTILDIGACRGEFASLVRSARFPEATIHSFEPSPKAFPTLNDVAARSGGRIVAHNIGLGETSETVKLHSAMDFLPASSLLASTIEAATAFPQIKRTEDLSVEIRALDEIVQLLDPSVEDELLVKIDVQGFEDRVIRGGRQTIARARAAIIEIQVADLYTDQPSFRDIFLEFDALGFEFTGVLDQFADKDGRVLYFDAVFIKP
jgi:FkbM family methyltransferase